MTIFEFCADKHSANYHLIHFRAENYSALFFSFISAVIKRQGLAVQALDNQLPFDDIKRTVAMSFLGQKNYYWLKDITSEAGTIKHWQALLSDYQGPHTLLFFAKTNTLKNLDGALVVDMPETIDKVAYQKLYTLFHATELVDPTFVEQIFAKQRIISLDNACILMNYQMVLGRRSEQFLAHWAEKIVSPEHSLFTLSQHFFAQDRAAFFALWNDCRLEFPDEFWIAFWAEQLWQATLFVHQAKNSSPQEARKYVTRLPFAFLNKYWHKYTVHYLVQAHDNLYQVDYALKNGGSSYALEVWYHNFFLQAFS